MQLIITEKRGGTTITIGVDNQATIQAFHSELSLWHHLARGIIRIANRVQKWRSKTGYSLTIHWRAGHEGISGNEAADEEAKKAALGLSSDKHLLPLSSENRQFHPLQEFSRRNRPTRAKSRNLAADTFRWERFSVHRNRPFRWPTSSAPQNESKRVGSNH